MLCMTDYLKHDAEEVVSHCNHTLVVKFLFSFFTLGSDSSCVAAPESSKHHAEPREKYETESGGWRG